MENIKDILEQGEKEFDRIFPCIQTGCDNNGNIAERVGEDEWEQQQCQYCDERRLPLKKLFISQQHKLLQSIVEEIDSEYEIAKNTKEFMQRSKWNEALDSLKAKLTSLNKTTNKV